MIDLKKVLSEITTEKVILIMKELGCKDYIEKEDYIMFKTICHHHDEDDGNHKLYYYKNSKLFVCYSNCGTFNLVDMFKKRYELLNLPYDFYKDIVLKIGDGSNTYLIEGFNNEYKSDYDKYKKLYSEINIPIISKTLLNTFTDYYTDEWLSDNISVEVMKHYNIKYSIDQNKIVIPHYNENGDLIGIRGRALNEEDLVLGKYMPMQIGGKFYSHPLAYNLYGLNIVKENLKNRRTAIIFEAEKSCLQYETYFGKENNISVAVCGSTLHKYQIDLLIRNGVDKVIIAFDKEEDFFNGESKYYSKLQKLCKKFNNLCDIGFIYDYNKKLNLKDSPTDKGKEVFLELSKKIIWVK